MADQKGESLDTAASTAGLFLYGWNATDDLKVPATLLGASAVATSAVATRTALKAVDTTLQTVSTLTEAGREGTFVWTAGNYSTQIAADSQEGVYVKANAIASSAGAWVRVRENGWLNVKHFGAVGDGTTNDKTAIQAAIDLNIGPVFFPPSTGPYILTSAIVLHNGTQLTGGYGETGASGASSMHQFPELRWTGTGTYCVTGDDTVDYLYHGSISGLSFSTAAGATYSWIFDFYDLVGWTFKGINCKQIDYTSGGIMRCRETAPANPNWVNVIYDFDFSVPTTGTQYLLDLVWTDSQISMGNFDGGKGVIYRGAGNVATDSVQFNRTGTGYAGLTLRKETASSGQFMVSNCAFDACTTYGLIIDGSASPSGTIYAPTIVGCVFRNPGATADIQFISHASTALSGPVIDACVFSEAAVTPAVVDEAFWRPTFGNNFYASGWVPFAPSGSYDARNRISALGRTGVSVLGLISARASKTVRGAANVAGMFGIEDANFPFALLGVKDGATPYVGASREADGDATPFGIMVNNAIVAQFGTDLSFINTGRIASSGTTHGIGYSTGAGGAVTQVTSRTTGVTIDRASGAITLFSAAGSTSWQSFTVTNAALAATDTVIVSQKSGTDLYEIHVTAVAAGSFRISYRTTGGTTTEQPVFNFAVIKAVAA